MPKKKVYIAYFSPPTLRLVTREADGELARMMDKLDRDIVSLCGLTPEMLTPEFKKRRQR
jgi:hypothetical protein